MATLSERMVRRLFVGLCIGLVIGGVLAAGLVALQWPTFAAAGGFWMAYLSAVVVGALTGLVAGKPIWASGAGIEAGLKAFFGVLLGAGAMFALREWAGAWSFDLSRIASGAEGPVGQLPMAALPLIGAVLGMFYELDNTGTADTPPAAGGPAARRRVAGAGARGAMPAAERRVRGPSAAAEGAPGAEAEEAGADAVEVRSPRAKR